jgi:hypothetical protein
MLEQVLEQTSPKTIALACLGLYILVAVAQWLAEERKIRALGGHAKKAPTWLPYGEDVVDFCGGNFF